MTSCCWFTLNSYSTLSFIPDDDHPLGRRCLRGSLESLERREWNDEIGKSHHPPFTSCHSLLFCMFFEENFSLCKSTSPFFVFIPKRKESLIFIHIFFFLRMLNFPNKGSSLSPVSSSKKTLVVNAWSMRTKNEKHVFHSFLHPSHLLLSMSPSSSFFVHHCRCVSLFSLESFEPHLLHSFNDFNDYKTKKTRRLTTRDKDTQRDRRRFPL